MTRLTSGDIEAVCDHLPAYDRHLQSATGRSLLGIGAAAAGIADVGPLQHHAASVKMAVVPVRGGLGIIGGFSAAVGGILRHLGIDAWVTDQADVAGFAEGVSGGAQVILASDDDLFAAFCIRQAKIVDNAQATARGYVAALDLMAGGLAGKSVLVLGCGPVGRWAVQALLLRRARICVFDRIATRSADLVRWAEAANRRAHIRAAATLEQALGDHDLIVDATDAADIVQARHVTERTRIAAPGMPCGVSPEARRRLGSRMLHDPLPIGVAVMACDAMRIVGVRSDADPQGERP